MGCGGVGRRASAGTPGGGRGWGGEEGGRLGPPLSARARFGPAPHTSCGSPGPWVSLSLFPVPTRPAGAAEGGWPRAPSLPPLCPSAAPLEELRGAEHEPEHRHLDTPACCCGVPLMAMATGRRPWGRQEGTGACPPAPQVTHLLGGSGTSDPLKCPARPVRSPAQTAGTGWGGGLRPRGRGSWRGPPWARRGASSTPLLGVPTLYFLFSFPLAYFLFLWGLLIWSLAGVLQHPFLPGALDPRPAPPRPALFSARSGPVSTR